MPRLDGVLEMPGGAVVWFRLLLATSVSVSLWLLLQLLCSRSVGGVAVPRRVYVEVVFAAAVLLTFLVISVM